MYTTAGVLAQHHRKRKHHAMEHRKTLLRSAFVPDATTGAGQRKHSGARTRGPSWCVRPQVAPRSMGPAVFPGSPPTRDTHWSLLEYAAQVAPRSVDPCFFWLMGKKNTDNVPPGVCGPRPPLAVWDPRFSRAHRQPAHSLFLLESAADPLPCCADAHGQACFEPQNLCDTRWTMERGAMVHKLFLWLIGLNQPMGMPRNQIDSGRHSVTSCQRQHQMDFGTRKLVCKLSKAIKFAASMLNLVLAWPHGSTRPYHDCLAVVT